MNSPITGKEMKLIKERRSMEFRKETFEVIFHTFKCEDSGEMFTTTDMDEVNVNQVYNQYRDAHNIPFPDEITAIREKYGVSAKKMSEILGFGVNSYRKYEAGEMPSVSNARLIQSVSSPKEFLRNVELCETLSENEKVKLNQKVLKLIEKESKLMFDLELKSYYLGDHLADVFSGYRNPSFEKLTEMVVFFSEKISPFKTKMNKLLFYADFLAFKKSCFSISGMRYRAIQMGPVPNNFQSIFEYLAHNDDVDIQYMQFPQGYYGEKFIARKDRQFNAELFTEFELGVLNEVSSIFMDTSTGDIIDISHLEEAWKKNVGDKDEISYQYAFDLTQV